MTVLLLVEIRHVKFFSASPTFSRSWDTNTLMIALAIAIAMDLGYNNYSYFKSGRAGVFGKSSFRNVAVAALRS